jgi:hypothetical protein
VFGHTLHEDQCLIPGAGPMSLLVNGNFKLVHEKGEQLVLCNSSMLAAAAMEN